MKTLSRKSFEEYCDLLDSCENNAVAGFGEAVNKAVNGFVNASTEENRSVYRDFIVYEVYGRIDTYVAQAQVRADDMFEAMTDCKPTTHEAFPFEQADARVRSAARHIFENNNPNEFVRVLESFIAGEVRMAANAAMVENVKAANK